MPHKEFQVITQQMLQDWVNGPGTGESILVDGQAPDFMPYSNFVHDHPTKAGSLFVTNSNLYWKARFWVPNDHQVIIEMEMFKSITVMFLATFNPTLGFVEEWEIVRGWL